MPAAALRFELPAAGPGLDLRLLRAPSFSVMAAQDPEAQITLEMVCRLTSLSAAGIYKQLREHRGFPAPCATSEAGGKLFNAGEVRDWMQSHGAKPRRKA